MDRQTLQFAVISILGILTVSVAAATLRTPLDRGTTGSRSGSGSGGGATQPASGSSGDLSVPFLGDLLVVLLGLLLVIFALAVLAAFVAGIWFAIRYRHDLVSSVPAAIVFLAGALVLLIVFWWVASTADPAPMDPGSAGGGEASGGESAEQSAPLSPVVLGSIVVLFVVLAAMIVFPRLAERIRPLGVELNVESPGGDRSDGRGEFDRQTPEDENELTNEVYRAWQAMTRDLDVSTPESTSPREFASAAIDAGFRSEDVRELTQLFEEVRYGRYEPSEERERRATAVRRRLEADDDGSAK